MANYKNPNQTFGRPAKYNTPEALKQMNELVYLYKQENPKAGEIKVQNMADFSKLKHEQDSQTYPIVFNRDAWSKYGMKFIVDADEPLDSLYGPNKDSPSKVTLPNITDIVRKYGSDRIKLLTYLQPVEAMLHESMSNEGKYLKIIEELQEQIKDLNGKLQLAKGTIDKFEKYTLHMANDSYNEKMRKQYGLIDQISINANERNKKAMISLDNLEELMPKNDETTEVQESPKPQGSTAADLLKRKQPTVLKP